MDREEVENLVEYGKSMNIKVTPFEINGQLGVHYMDFESFSFEAVLRDLNTIKAQKEARS